MAVGVTHATPATLPNDPTKEVSSTAWNEAHTVTGLSTVAESGSYADLSGKPVLAAVATSGAYSSLSGTPVIPSAIFQQIAVAGQSTVVAASVSSGIELVAGSNITILATTSGNAVTLSAAAGSAAAAWPVGSVYMATTSTSPATKLGFGTWTALEGKFVAGVKAGDAEFGAGVSGGATGTSYTPSGTNAAVSYTPSGTLDLGLYVAKGAIAWPATAPAFVGNALTATASVSWPTGVPVFAGTTATATSSVNWPTGVPTYAGTPHRHELPIVHTSATSLLFLPTGTFGVGASRVPDVRVTATGLTASANLLADVTNSGVVMLSNSGTSAGVISWPASVPQALASVVPAGIISWPATAPAAVVSATPAGANTWPTGVPVFTGATGSGSGIFTGITKDVGAQTFTGIAKTVAILPPYFTLYMWERVS